MIWKQNATIEILNTLCKGCMLEYLQIEFTEIGQDFIKATLPVDHRTTQPMGLLHGGATATLAETLGSVAAQLCLTDLSTQATVGIELNINHLKAQTNGYVTGIVQPVRLGRKIQVWNIEIFNDTDQLISVSRLTTMTLEK